jgi:hypothetical protein
MNKYLSLPKVMSNLLIFLELSICVAYFFIAPAYGQEIVEETNERQIKVSPPVNIESSIDLSKQQNEEDILRSIDNFDTNLTDTSVFLEKLELEQIDYLDYQPLLLDEKYLTDIEQTFPELFIGIDSFEQLDFDTIFADEILAEEMPLSQLPQLSLPMKSLMKKPQGVGVKGTEEAIINQLDKSDLMDFDVDEEFWKTELIEKKSPTVKPNLLDEIETIDDLHELELNYE